MILKITKWVLILIAILVIGLVTLLETGSRLSVDRDYSHSQNTEALPEFSSQTQSGLVRIAANGYEFRARIAGFGQADGAADKPAVILLHGFPVSSAMWIELMEPLARAGYRVLAFDQRGYSPGARPGDVDAYTVDKLSDDVIAVADSVGLEQFHLIGHDWGAVIGWTTIMRHPPRVLSWTGLSIAHPAAFSAALEYDPDQKSRSRYFMLFITPWLPEALFSFNDFKMLKGVYSNMSAQQREEYLALFSEPGALTAALNWYRAMTVSLNSVGDLAIEVTTPTLFIWGNNDQAVGRWGVEAQEQYMSGPYELIELDAGHWLMEDYPREITAAVLQHLAAYSAAR